MGILKGKTIVITGSGRGIGKSVALACAKEGANVGLTARTLDELNEVKDEIIKLGTQIKVSVKTADVKKYEEIESAFKAFYEELGEINGVIANAGYSRMWDSHEFDSNKFSEIINVNVSGVFYTFKAAFPYLKKDDKSKKARFIITGSAAFTNPMPKFAAYTASKYAVVGLQSSLALEYKKENIIFNMILPTMVDTRLARGRKAGDGNKPPNVKNPQELNDYYLFLLSEEANRINNALIFTNDFDEVKKYLAEAPSGKSDNWDVFKDYLQEKSPNTYTNVKKLGKLVDFIIKTS
ncbi:MAG: SDR family NAD(P)-dependent oxidoreductase [Candidatus Lokiarchaeota archaeon]|nr:SDR family NAD(P)-dependent oxidoreductase [Candidatus Lokiarchaeota archaeon]